MKKINKTELRIARRRFRKKAHNTLLASQRFLLIAGILCGSTLMAALTIGAVLAIRTKQNAGILLMIFTLQVLICRGVKVGINSIPKISKKITNLIVERTDDQISAMKAFIVYPSVKAQIGEHFVVYREDNKMFTRWKWKRQ